MKQNYLFKTLFLLCALLVGMSVSAADKWLKTAPADLATGDVVVIVDQTSSRAMSNDQGTSKAPVATAVTLSADKSEIAADVAENLQFVVSANNGSYKFGVADTENFVYCTNTNNGVRVGTNENNVFTISDNKGVDFLVNTATSRYIGVYNSQDWRCYTSINANIKECVTAFYKKVAGEADTRIETEMSIGSNPTNTGMVGETIDLPGAAVLVEGISEVNGATINWTSSNEEVATIDIDNSKINLLKAGTTTIRASFAGDNEYQPCSSSYTVTVTAPATAYTSLKALQEAVTSTSTDVTIQFNNVFVTAVKNDNAYLADADGYGVLLYTKDHGLEAGQVLNGTIDAKLVLYRGQTEITNFNKEGLTITTTELTPAEKTIDAITVANQSTLVTLKNVTFADGKLTDGTNAITYYDNFSAGSLEEDKTYDITGIVIVYNTTLEIAPRTADDIVEVQTIVDERLDVVMSFPEASYEVTLGEDFTAPVLTITEGYDGTVAYISSDETVAKVAADGAVTILAAGTTTITATAPATDNYKSATASYKLTVNAGEEPTPEPIEGDKFVKVTKTEDIVNGQYLIIYEEGNVAFNGGLETLDAVSNTVDVTIVNGEIAATDENKKAIFEINTTTGTLKSASGLYIGVSSNSNGLKTAADAATYTHTFTVDEDGNAVIAAVFDESTMTMRFNKASNQNRFRYYKSGQEPVALYKYVGETPITTGIQTVNHTNVADGAYFNLAGQRVAAPAKGLYIVNGKKVVVK